TSTLMTLGRLALAAAAAAATAGRRSPSLTGPLNSALSLASRPTDASRPDVPASGLAATRRGACAQRLLVFAVVDDPRQFRAQVLAMDDAIDETVLQQELARLKPFGQLEPHGVPDGALAGKAH